MYDSSDVSNKTAEYPVSMEGSGRWHWKPTPSVTPYTTATVSCPQAAGGNTWQMGRQKYFREHLTCFNSTKYNSNMSP